MNALFFLVIYSSYLTNTLNKMNKYILSVRHLSNKGFINVGLKFTQEGGNNY